MIGRLTGILVEKNPPQILLDCNGVGYEVNVSMNTFCNLPAGNEPVTLHIQHIVREDAHLLYGFMKLDERHAFKELLRINGVGARMALSVLSGMTVDELTYAVTTHDVARLVCIPGIGKKIAERLLLELSGRMGAKLGESSIESGRFMPSNDVLDALLALGYSEKEALVATRELPADNDVGMNIKLALKKLSAT